MTASAQNPNPGRRLIDAHLDGSLSDKESAELARWLDADPTHIEHLLDRATLHLSLRKSLTRNASSSRPQSATKRTPAISRPIPFIIYPIAIAAALLFTAAIVGVYLLAFTTDPQPDQIKPDQPGPAVATLIENTGDLRTPHGYPAEGDDFGRGEYTLDHGTAEFMLTNAVNVKLRGDTRLYMRNDMNVSLTRGSAAFVVPKDAEGFTVHLPDKSRIVDLGTAFRVEIDDDGKPQVRVSEGSVQWIPADADAQPVLIAAGRSASFVDGVPVLSSIVADLRRNFVAGEVAGDTSDATRPGQWSYYSQDEENPDRITPLAWDAHPSEGSNYENATDDHSDGHHGAFNAWPLVGLNKQFDGTVNTNEVFVHPGHDDATYVPSGEEFLLLRWTAGEDQAGTLRIAGGFRKLAEEGDGVGLTILVNGVEQFRQTVTGGTAYDTSAATFDFDVAIEPGQHVDFVVDHGEAENLFEDSAALSATLNLTAIGLPDPVSEGGDSSTHSPHATEILK